MIQEIPPLVILQKVRGNPGCEGQRMSSVTFWSSVVLFVMSEDVGTAIAPNNRVQVDSGIGDSTGR